MSEDNKIDKIMQEMTNTAELQSYADAQYQTIVSLNKQINELKAKNSSLETTLKSIPASDSKIIQFPQYSITAEEEICLKQLENLRVASSGRDLTLEEARKLEIYAKILVSIRSKEKDVTGEYKKLSTEELLKLSQDLANESK
jgi:hypothetical protein